MANKTAVILDGARFREAQSGDTILLRDDVDFNQYEGLQFVVENRTSDPSSPVTGQLWIRTDL